MFRTLLFFGKQQLGKKQVFCQISPNFVINHFADLADEKHRSAAGPFVKTVYLQNCAQFLSQIVSVHFNGSLSSVLQFNPVGFVLLDHITLLLAIVFTLSLLLLRTFVEYTGFCFVTTVCFASAFILLIVEWY